MYQPNLMFLREWLENIIIEENIMFQINIWDISADK